MHRLRSHIALALALDSDSARRLSFAVAHRTRKNVLIFDSDASKPTFAVKLGPINEVERVFKVMQALNDEAPDCVPKPLSFSIYKGQGLLIQEGVAGTPWFRFDSVFDCPEKKTILLRVALDALILLDAKTRKICEKYPFLFGSNNFSESIRKTLADGLKIIDRIDLLHIAEGSSKIIEELPQELRIPQHGDFCLNNLIVHDREFKIIDFDEFGAQKVPLYDLISLILSYRLFLNAADDVSEIVQEIKKLSGMYKYEFSLPEIEALFLYYLICYLAASIKEDKNRREGTIRRHLFLLDETLGRFASSSNEHSSSARLL